MEHTSEGLTLCMGNQHTLLYPLTHICDYQPLLQVEKRIISGIGANYGEGAYEDDLVYKSTLIS